jgi:hypothetical protein
VDELVLNAVENCVRKLKNFDPGKTSNPFSYYTQIAYFSFIGTIDNERNEAYVKYKSIIQRLTSSELANSPDDITAVQEHAMDNVELQIGHLEEYIKAFEDKKLARKASNKSKKKKSKDEVLSLMDDVIERKTELKGGSDIINLFDLANKATFRKGNNEENKLENLLQ